MSKQIIHTDQAPAAIGPYSQAVRAGNTVYFSGQIPLDPVTGNLVDGDIAAQARRAFDNLKAVLQAAGCSFDDVVDVTTFHTDPQAQWSRLSAIREQEIGQRPYPNWTAVGVNWLAGFDFEIKVIARIPASSPASTVASASVD